MPDFENEVKSSFMAPQCPPPPSIKLVAMQMVGKKKFFDV